MTAFLRHRPVFTHILVALDESQPAEWALDLAIRVANEMKATISLVHVAAPPHMGFDPTSQSTLLKLAAADHPVLAAGRVRLPHDLAGELILREGEPILEIVQAARDRGVDLIVIGSHGRTGLGRAILGSTAEAVVRRAPCPVLTVSQPPSSEILASSEIPRPYEVAKES